MFLMFVCTPNNGRSILQIGMKLFNDMVVPYNLALLLKYYCHINVEVVSTVGAVKYLYKYIMTGGTRAAVQLRKQGEPRQPQPAMNIQQNDDHIHRDEIQHHIDGQ